MKQCVIKSFMKTEVDNSDLKELYSRWLGAKSRFEMAQSMNNDAEHINTFEAHYKGISKELHNILWTRGYRTKAQVELVLNSLKEEKPKTTEKPTLTLIKGGK